MFNLNSLCLLVCLFACLFASLRPSHQLFSHVRAGLPGLKHICVSDLLYLILVQVNSSYCMIEQAIGSKNHWTKWQL